MTTNTHPYRSSDNRKPVCVACDALAHLRCPRCKRPFCIDHAATAPCCADCASAAERRVERVSLGTLAGYATGVGGLSSYLFMLEPGLGILAGTLGVLGSVVVSALARRLARGRARGWEPVEGTALRAGRAGNAPRERRRVRLLGGRSVRASSFQASIGRHPL